MYMMHETKTFSTEYQFFGCFCTADHCSYPFLAVSAQGPLWFVKMDLCVLERREKHFSRLFCGV
jgi:hypothetical protein